MAWQHFPLNPDPQALVSREPMHELLLAAQERGVPVYSWPLEHGGVWSGWGLRSQIDFNVDKDYWYADNFEESKKYTTGPTTSTHQNIFEDVFGAGVTDWPYQSYARDGIRARDLNQIFQVLDKLRYIRVTPQQVYLESYNRKHGIKREQLSEWHPHDDYQVGPHITAAQQAIETAACDNKYPAIDYHLGLHVRAQFGGCLYDYDLHEYYAQWDTRRWNSVEAYRLDFPSGYYVTDFTWSGIKATFRKSGYRCGKYRMVGDRQTHYWPLGRTLDTQIRLVVSTIENFPYVYEDAAAYGNKVGNITFPSGLFTGYPSDPCYVEEIRELGEGSGVTGTDDLWMLICMDPADDYSVAGADLASLWDPEWYYDPEHPPSLVAGGGGCESIDLGFGPFFVTAKFDHQT
jgi:hypothetical protein